MNKILILINSFEMGGAEKLLIYFLNQAVKYDEFDIHVCSLYKKNFFKNELSNCNVKFIDLNLKNKYSLIGILKLINLIKRENYNLIHVHLFPSSLYLYLASFFINKDIKLIFTEHSISNRRRKYFIFKILDFLVYNRYHKIICVSDRVRESLIEWIPIIKSKVVVINNGVPILNNSVNVKQNKIYDILFMGRLEKIKGLDVLLNAMKIIVEKSYNLKLAIVGHGSLKNYLVNLTKMLKIENNIIFINSVHNIKSIMEISKLLVLPSKYEGLPMIVLEAMSNNIPVISTKVGGITELIKDKYNGILVEPNNPEDLANAILTLLYDERLYNFIKKNAFETVKKYYNINTHTERILSLYKEMLELI